MREPEPGDRGAAPQVAEIPQQKPWSRDSQMYAAVGWSSFLVASFATMLCFAFVDPAELEFMVEQSVETARMTGYAIGFFFFWMMTALTGFIVAYLLRATRRGSSD